MIERGTAKVGIITRGYAVTSMLGSSVEMTFSSPGEVSAPMVTATTRSAMPNRHQARAAAGPPGAPFASIQAT